MGGPTNIASRCTMTTSKLGGEPSCRRRALMSLATARFSCWCISKAIVLPNDGTRGGSWWFHWRAPSWLSRFIWRDSTSRGCEASSRLVPDK
jgi:hypothetical protein